MTDGQRLALEQLRGIADVEPSFIVGAPSERKGELWVEISLTTAAIPRGAGVRLRARETFLVLVGKRFPYAPPSVVTTHRRWAGTPHVHWGCLLCLYLAPAVEWNPADGMFGFVDRLNEWLASAAADELDPDAAPLHPPINYDIDPTMPQIIVRANAPVPAGEIFAGAAVFDRPAELRGRVDIVGFTSFAEIAAGGWPDQFGLTLVISGEFDWEYPDTVTDLVTLLAERGLERELLINMLEVAAQQIPDDQPLVVLIGTPMRRIEGQRLIHLVAWAIPPDETKYLRYRRLKEADDQVLREGGEAAEWLFDHWAGTSKLAWCRVREDRPEVVRPREEGSPLTSFCGTSVVVWGCSALGAPVAEAIARVKPRKLILYDKGYVIPGLLVRQPFTDDDIGHAKATTLANRLKATLPTLDVEGRTTNVLDGPLERADWSDDADILIDATASAAVAAKLERVRRQAAQDTWIVSAVFGHAATRGLATVTPPKHPAGPHDLTRKTKIRLRTKAWPRKRASGYKAFADEFWPAQPRGDIFQPEPGCSEPTFRGSQAETQALAQTMLLWAAARIATNSEDGSALLVSLPTLTAAEQPEPRQIELYHPSDLALVEGIQGYQVRISPGSLAEIQAHIRNNDRAGNPADETGGLLFGQRDDATGVVYVSEVIGPPPDSERSSTRFVCGVEGVDRYRDEKRDRGLGGLGFVGTWHTHPDDAPIPSNIDVAGMGGIVLSTEPVIPKALLIIVGANADRPLLGAYMFDRRDLRPPHVVRAHVIVTQPARQPVTEQNIGLALSGGGFRALAFHLGCLRALEDRRLLDRVKVVSGVSGGSLAAALWAYSNDEFASFDARVRGLLANGLQADIARRALLSTRAIRTAGTVATAGMLAMLARLPLRSKARRVPPLRRRSSITDAMVDTFANLLPGESLSDPRRNNIDIVLNACELRTGSAFRFGSRESHCYRSGTVTDQIPVAFAVAASAAYPLLLPALDRTMRFRRRDGSEHEQRVVLTDGGVFDNLGTSVLEPGRDPGITITHEIDYIIACDAGRGILGDAYVPYGFPSRMRRAFETTHRKAQDGVRNRLHHHSATDAVGGFVLPYLGQLDGELPVLPVDLPRRDQVVDYPTDLKPMTHQTIELLARRGEKLTRLLLEFHCPDL